MVPSLRSDLTTELGPRPVETGRSWVDRPRTNSLWRAGSGVPQGAADQEGRGAMTSAIAKRVVDIVAAIVLLVVALPIIAVSALLTMAVLRTSPFFTQTRI